MGGRQHERRKEGKFDSIGPYELRGLNKKDMW